MLTSRKLVLLDGNVLVVQRDMTPPCLVDPPSSRLLRGERVSRAPITAFVLFQGAAFDQVFYVRGCSVLINC